MGKTLQGGLCFWGSVDNNPLPLSVWLTDHALTFWQLNEEHPCTEVSIPLQKWEIRNWKSELSEKLIYKLQHFYCPIISAVFFSTNGVRAITTYFLDNSLLRLHAGMLCFHDSGRGSYSLRRKSPVLDLLIRPIRMGCCPAAVSYTSWTCREISVLHFFLLLHICGVWDCCKDSL